MGSFWEEAQASESMEFDEETFLAPSTVKDITDLIYVGRIEETFDLFTHKFTMRSLSVGDEFKIASLVKDLQDSPLARNRAVAAATVAASLERVDGKPIATAIRQNEEIIYRKFALVLELSWDVIEELYKKYLEIESKVTDAFRELEKKAQSPTSFSFLEPLNDKDASIEANPTQSEI